MKKLTEMTTSGEAIALSTTDPSSQDAVFVPFLKSSDTNNNILYRRKRKMGKKILESLQLDGMKAVSEALIASINENEDSPFKRINNMKTLLECKKNKEEFKKLMAEKLAAKNGKKPDETASKEQTPAPAPKKMSLKDKIAQRKASKKVTEGKETCCICGAENDKCEKNGDKSVCPECFKLLEKKKRINEGIERLTQAKKKQLMESAKKRVLSESSDFSKEMEIMMAARKRHGKLTEAFVDKSNGLSDTIVGIDFNRHNAFKKIETVALQVKAEEDLKKYFETNDDLRDKKVVLKYDEHSDSFVIGIVLNENPDLSVNDASNIVDKCSAAIFNEMESLGIDVSGIDTNCSIINIVY